MIHFYMLLTFHMFRSHLQIQKKEKNTHQKPVLALVNTQLTAFEKDLIHLLFSVICQSHLFLLGEIIFRFLFKTFSPKWLFLTQDLLEIFLEMNNFCKIVEEEGKQKKKKRFFLSLMYSRTVWLSIHCWTSSEL